MLKVERLDRRIWEPAAGKGAIVDVLRAAGHSGAPGDMLATALMQVAVEIAVSSFGREDAATRLRAALDSLLKAEGPEETTH